MRHLKNIAAITLAAALLQSFLPWWCLAIPCIAFGFFYGNKGGSSFWTAFISIAVLWISLALFTTFRAGTGLAEQVAGLFPGKSVVVLVVLTGIIGGLSGGISSLTGYYGRRLI
ncbi:MAG: hypothetical protein FJZ78_04135 [Bacteroidetes bacterium]|nr:hypothetical protein [Bacteroidota bacterium]